MGGGMGGLEFIRSCFLVSVISLASGLQIAPRTASLGAYQSAALRPHFAPPVMQFGPPGEGGGGLSRDNEPEEFFSTNMDSMSDEEKLKSPVVIGGVLLIVAPFLIGMIALTLAKQNSKILRVTG